MNIYLEKVKVGMFILPHITKSNPRDKQQTSRTAETIPVGNKHQTPNKQDSRNYTSRKQDKKNYKMEF